ncbi:DUF11 domain-containing protein [Clostridium botulinum]|nr:DUF11 domain-containing protein [Clostridium botulinum]NFH70071.1 DUF11 domain-containing protein [Clostridium botulinum]NFP01857.1 DUF11 domain-containing protein [Clostridium botulinum]
MKNCFKKILIMFIMVLGIVGMYTINAFADDNFEIGTNNLNNTLENSAKVGDILEHPEIGWKRYDNTNKYIKSNESNISGQFFYNSTLFQFWENSNCEFSFYGSKLRIITAVNTIGSNNIVVTIDGVEYPKYSCNYNLNYQVVSFEKINLSNTLHNVKVVNKGDGYGWFDAIDVDSQGGLGDLNQSISLNKSSLNLKESTSEKLTATTTPAAIDIDWSSSDETVAIVDSNGNVKAIKEGQATITAKIKGSDIKSTCIVTVTKKDVLVEPEQPTNPEQEYIINTAYAKGDNTNNASGQVSIIFKGVAEAQLKVIKTADVDSVYVGDNFTYTIEVTNTSDKIAKSVVIKDNAPNHIQFIPSEVITTQGKIDSSSTSKNIIVNVGDIPPEGKVIIKIPVLVIE